MTDTEIPLEAADEQPSLQARLVVVGLLVLLVAGALAGLAFIAAQLVGSDEPWVVEAGVPVEVTISSGATASSIYQTLHEAGVARSSELQAAATQLGVEERLQAGTYAFVTDMPPAEVVRQLAQGANALGGDTFTIIEGWTVDKIIEELSSATEHTQAEFQRVLRSDALSSPYLPETSVHIDALSRWEGLLFPAKYPLSSDATPESILRPMVEEMTARLGAVDWFRIEALGVTRYEALIVASLVQREAGTNEERSTIASVVYNRLAIPMRLQIDATVIYALGYNPGRVLAAHLEVESPYNTYRNDGLPPTPIGTAGIASIEAAVDPATTSYLFYVLGGDDGSHLFADTYEGHQENIEVARNEGVRP